LPQARTKTVTKDEIAMKAARGVLALVAICLIIVALSLAGAIADFVNHIALDIDGILLLLTCLMMGGLFSLMLFLIAREQGWIPRRQKDLAPAPAAAKK
jgi:uncharacterized Tic20 family protein